MPFSTNDFLRAAERVEKLQAHQCHRDLYAVRERYARRLREMSAEPNKELHIDALNTLYLFDYTTWGGRAVN